MAAGSLAPRTARSAAGTFSGTTASLADRTVLQAVAIAGRCPSSSVLVVSSLGLSSSGDSRCSPPGVKRNRPTICLTSIRVPRTIDLLRHRHHPIEELEVLHPHNASRQRPRDNSHGLGVAWVSRLLHPRRGHRVIKKTGDLWRVARSG